jgi:lysozyme
MEKLANQNIKFVYIKATEGSKSIDENFFVNWQNGQTSGMYIGDYHFFSFDSDGKEQAEHFINTVGVLSGTLIPVVDVEYYGDKEKNPPDKETIVSGLKEYLRLLEKEYQVKPMLYTTEKVYAKYIKESFDEYPIWIRSVYYPAKYVAGENWLFWQYSDREILEGYIGEEKYIDMNVFHGEEEELGQYLCP